jgi:hypothetical protein
MNCMSKERAKLACWQAGLLAMGGNDGRTVLAEEHLGA